MSIGIQDLQYQYSNYSILQEKQALQAELAGKNQAAQNNEKITEILGKATEDKIDITTEQDRDKLKKLATQLSTDARTESRINASAFRAMTAMLFKDQSVDTVSPLKSLASMNQTSATTATDSTKDPWSAEAISEKILKFAKSLANGDDSKIDMLREAMQKGFEAAEHAWGGKLPDVSYETRKLIEQGFENWKNPTLEA